jgi:uncharacterized membrane protein
MTLMNKNQYLYELRGKLANLPEGEVNSAMAYYEEYFLDAGEENEERVIAELGTPNAVASKIIGEFALADAAPPIGAQAVYSPTAATRNSARTLWIVILAVLASPIALPLAFAAVVIVFALLVSVLAVIIAIGVAGVALIAAGVFAIVVGIWALFIEFGTALFQIGLGLLSIGIGILLTLGVITVTPAFFKGLQRMLGALLVRKAA